MFTDLLDQISQYLTTVPLWWQVILVSLVAVPLAAVFALLLLRLVDGTARLWNGFWAGLGPAEDRQDSPTPGPDTRLTDN